MAISSSTRIFLAGHKGFIGSAVFEHLKKNGFYEVITLPRKDLDLCNSAETTSVLMRTRKGLCVKAKTEKLLF